MNVVIYARFSSSSQREASIEEQVKVCREYAKKNDYNIVKVYSDSALTGKNDNRPALLKLLSDSSKNEFSAVLVYSIDRFGRNLIQTLTNEKKLKDNNVTLLSVTESFSNDPSGNFFRNIMMSYAQFYSDELSVKITRGMDYNAERCMYNGGGVPLGYQINKDKHFEINPDTAPIVQSIFEMYANGKTVTEITNTLNAQGLKTSKGVPFNKNSLHTMLKNRRYLGIYIHKGVETVDGMPRIISDELFNKVAEIMEKNRKAPARAKAKVEYLLTTKLFCGHCKEMMTGFSGTGKQGKVYHYYICNGRKNKICKKKMVDKDYIENLVVSECRRLLSAENIRKIAKEVVAICEAEKDNTNLKHLQKLLAENERKQHNTINAIMESDIESVRKSLGEKIPILEKEHNEIEKMIAEEEVPYPTLTETDIRFFLNQLKKGNIKDIKYRSMLINVFVNKIYLYDDRLTITYNSGDEPITISDQLLSEIQDKGENERLLFLDESGPP
jgi:DNA invertase Pin-like site-specific DNA recombinase